MEDVITSPCRNKKKCTLPKSRKYLGKWNIFKVCSDLFHLLVCLLLCSRYKRKMRTGNFSGACMWCGWLSSPWGLEDLKGRPATGALHARPLAAFLAAVPGIPRVEHYPAWSKDAVAPCAAGRRPDPEHRKSPPEDGSKISLRLSRPAGSMEPRPASGAQPLSTQGLAHLLMESNWLQGSHLCVGNQI